MKRGVMRTGHQGKGTRPGATWKIYFAEVNAGLYGCKYLLVFIDTISGWTEASPTKHKMGAMVVKKILDETIPKYHLPVLSGSKNRPAFISQLTQKLTKTMGNNWKLHCDYCPQSSDQGKG